MKLDRLETHDRLEYFHQDQAHIIFQGADDCLKRNPDSLMMQELSPYVYLFAHPRTLGWDERMAEFFTGKYLSFDQVPDKKLFWQPRLSKPEVQQNSYLFRAISHTDTVEVMWLIPPHELWPQYQRGNLTEEETILWSINQYIHNKQQLEAPEHDDLSQDRVQNIWNKIIKAKHDKTHSM